MGDDSDSYARDMTLGGGEYNFIQVGGESPVTLTITESVTIYSQYLFNAVLVLSPALLASPSLGDLSIEIRAGESVWIDREATNPQDHLRQNRDHFFYFLVNDPQADTFVDVSRTSFSFHTTERGDVDRLSARASGGSGGVLQPWWDQEQVPANGGNGGSITVVATGGDVVLDTPGLGDNSSLIASGGIPAMAGGQGGSGGQIAIRAENLALDDFAIGAAGGYGRNGGYGGDGGAVNLQVESVSVDFGVPLWHISVNGGAGGDGIRDDNAPEGVDGGNGGDVGRIDSSFDLGDAVEVLDDPGRAGRGGFGSDGQGIDGVPGQSTSELPPADVPEATTDTWTVMAYIAADDDPRVEPGSILDRGRAVEGDTIFDDFLRQLADLETRLPANAEINVLVQIDFNYNPRVVETYYGRSNAIPFDFEGVLRGRLVGSDSTLASAQTPQFGSVLDVHEDLSFPFQPRSVEGNTGDPEELAEFVAWAVQDAPAERYMLMISGHANGWKGIATDDTHDNAQLDTEILTPRELDEALTRIDELALADPNFDRLDILALDGCATSVVAMAGAVAGHNVDFVVASQQKAKLELLAGDWIGSLTSEAATAQIAREIAFSHKLRQAAAVSVADLQAVLSALTDFVALAIDNPSYLTVVRDSIADTPLSTIYSTTTWAGRFEPVLPSFINNSLIADYYHRDLTAIMRNVEAAATSPLRDAATRVRASIETAIPPHFNSSRDARLRGLSIYAPYSRLNPAGSIQSRYFADPVGRSTGWADLLARVNGLPIYEAPGPVAPVVPDDARLLVRAQRTDGNRFDNVFFQPATAGLLSVDVHRLGLGSAFDVDLFRLNQDNTATQVASGDAGELTASVEGEFRYFVRIGEAGFGSAAGSDEFVVALTLDKSQLSFPIIGTATSVGYARPGDSRPAAITLQNTSPLPVTVSEVQQYAGVETVVIDDAYPISFPVVLAPGDSWALPLLVGTQDASDGFVGMRVHLDGPGQQPVDVQIDVSHGVLPGDYDGNGFVDIGDYDLWSSSFGSTSVLAADGNGNGEVDIGDYTIWRDSLGRSAPTKPIAGDYDRDSDVDDDDYAFWRSHYGVTQGVGLQADGNRDGVVDLADYTIWRDNLGDSVDTAFLAGDYDRDTDFDTNREKATAGIGLRAGGTSNGVVDNVDYTAWRNNYGDLQAVVARAAANESEIDPPLPFPLAVPLGASAGSRISVVERSGPTADVSDRRLLLLVDQAMAQFAETVPSAGSIEGLPSEAESEESNEDWVTSLAAWVAEDHMPIQQQF